MFKSKGIILFLAIFLSSTANAKIENITVSYCQNCEPYQFEDGEGYADGSIIDIWRLWSIKTGISINFVPNNPRESVQVVASGRVDAHAGLFYNKSRADLFEFGDVLSIDEGYVFLSNKLPDIDGFDELASINVGVVGGGQSEKELRVNLSGTSIIIYDNVNDLFKDIAAGKLMAFTLPKEIGILYLKKNGLLGEFKISKKHLIYSKNRRMAVKKGNKELIDTINSGMKLITDSERLTVEHRWSSAVSDRDEEQVVDNSDGIILSAKEEEWLANNPLVTIGIDKSYPPIDFIDEAGSHRGITADYLEKISELTGITFRPVPGENWEDMLEKAKEREIDALATLEFSNERAKYWDFAGSYFKSPYAIVGRKGGPIFSSIEQLAGKTLAVEKGFHFHQWVTQNHPEIKISLVTNTLEALEALSHGEVDAYVGNQVVVMWLLVKHRLINLSVLESIEYQNSELNFAVRKDWKELTSIIEKAINSITEEQHQEIEVRWLLGGQLVSPNVYNKVEKFELTLPEVKWIDSNLNIDIGVHSSFAPYEFLNSDGQYKGLLADYGAIIENQIDIRMNPRFYESWSDIFKGLDSGEIVAAPGVMPTKELADKYLFSKPYVNSAIVVFTRKETKNLNNVSDLKGKRLAVVEEFMPEDFSFSTYSSSLIQRFDSVDAALQAVSQNAADAYIGNILTAISSIERQSINNIHMAFKTPYKFTLAYAISKDNIDFQSLLNKSLDTFSEDAIYHIENKWLRLHLDRNLKVLSKSMRDRSDFFVKENYIYSLYGIAFILLLGIVLYKLKDFVGNKLEKSNSLGILVTSLLIFFTIVIIFTWKVLSFIEKDVRIEIAESLTSVNNSVFQSLEIWMDGRLSAIQGLTSDPVIPALARELTSIRRSSALLANSSVQKTIRNIYSKHNSNIGAEGFFIISLDGIAVASTRNENLGLSNIIYDTNDELFTRVLRGETVFVPPMLTDVPLKNADGLIDENAKTMFVVSPLFSRSGKIIAVIAIRFDPEKRFFPIIESGVFGDTGETYALDAKAKIINESRFEGFIRGWLEKSANEKVEVRNPGGNLEDGFRPLVDPTRWPLTLMASEVIKGARGNDSNGYPDYRGVSVLGAWSWSDKLGIGLATEVDLSEALALHYNKRTLIMTGLIVLACAVLSLLLISIWLRERGKIWLHSIAGGRVSSSFRQSSTSLLIGGFTIMLILAIAMAAFALREGNRTSVLTKNMFRHPLSVSNSVLDAYTEILSIQNKMIELEVIRELKTINESVKEIEHIEEKVYRDFKLIRERYLGDQRNIDQAFNAFVTWKSLRQQEIQLRYSGRHIEADIFAQSQVADELSTLTDEMQDLVDFARNKAVEFLSESQQRYDDGKKILFAFLGVLILAGLINIAFVILRVSRSERALYASEKGIRSIIDNAADGIVVFTETGSIQKFSPAAEAIFGYKETELLERSVSLLMPDVFDKHISSVDLGSSRECLGIHKSKHSFPMELAIGVFQIGSIRLFTGIFRDISERKTVEVALRDSQERFELAVAGSGDALWGYDGINKSVWCSPRFNQMLGYSESEEISFDELILRVHTDDAVNNKEAFIEHLKHDKAYDSELRLKNKAGDYRWFRIRGSSLRSSDGRAYRTSGSITDITENKQLEAVLAARRQELQMILDTSPAAVAITVDNICQFANKSMVDRFGISLGDSPAIMLDQTSTLEGVSDSFYKEYEVQVMSLDEELRDLLVSVYSIDYQNNRGFLYWAIDISDLKAIQYELSEAKQLAEQATDAKSNFLANMSHEIRTPMNAIMGMTHLALQSDLTNKQQNQIQKVYHSAESLLGIINDILDFSKIEAGKLDMESIHFNLEDVFENLTNLIGYKVNEKKLELIYDFPVSLPTSLIGDQLRLGQVLLNICNNAVKFADKGDIAVVVQVVQETHEQVELRFTIKDQGLGISADQQQYLFKSFSQADASTTRNYGGTGLGLAISKKLVHLMGGNIGVESELGHGSAFHFTAIFGKYNDQSKSVNIDLLKNTNYQALVVEDNAYTCQVITRILQEVGITVVTIPSYKEFLSNSNSNSNLANEYDLILIDTKYAFDNEINQFIKLMTDTTDVCIPILMLGRPNESEAYDVDGLNIIEVLDKPVINTRLIRTVLQALGLFKKDNRHSVLSTKNGLNMAIAKLEGSEVLLVEDNELNQELALELLRSNGIKVEVANNGIEAIEMLERKEFDGVLMDCQMPLMDGYEATRQIRTQGKYEELPILAMSANVMTGDREKAIDVGMNDYISKPINIIDMFTTMAKWITPAVPVVKRQVDLANYHNIVDDFTELPGIDVKLGLYTSQGNKKLYQKLLHSFRDNEANFKQKFEQALIDPDPNAAVRCAHSLKGSALNIGANDVAVVAATLEEACLDESLQPFEHQLKNVIEQLKIVLEGLFQLDDYDEIEGRYIPPENINALLTELRQLLEDDDGDATEIVRQLKEIPELTNPIKPVAAAVEGYDFDTALSELNKLNSFNVEGNGD